MEEEDGDIIKVLYQSGPVTALTVIKDILLAGIGSYLHIYNLRTTQRTQVIKTLPHQNIHGISEAFSSNEESSEKLLCIFGEKTFQVVLFNQQTNRISRHGKSVEISDWIWDVRWLESREESNGFDCLALVTGHNCIIRINWRSSQVLDKVQCEEQCILYCGHFIGSRWDQLILAAGTVFNQIILWAPTTNLTSDENSTISKPFHQLTGHQGVIFSVNYHKGLKRICSASDDRSIRVWQLIFSNSFENNPSIFDWNNMVSECIHVLYGHQARVWRAHLTSTGMASIGEDATCCIWDHNGKISQKFKGHKGKGIWSMALNRSEDLVVTGGGDSSIRVWSVHMDLSSNKLSSKQLQITHLETEKENPNFPRGVTYINFNTVLVMTNSGTLYRYCLIHSAWATVMDDPTFVSYSCFSVSRKTQTIAVGNLSGTIRLFQSSEETSDDDCLCECRFIKLTLPGFYEGKVFNLFWMDDVYLLSTGPEGRMTLSILKSGNSSFLGLEPLNQFILPQSKQRWATAACLLQGMKALVCGDRNGSIHLYLIEQDIQQPLTQKQSFYKLHGKAGVTDVCSHRGYVFTAGRDGQYRQFNLTDDGTLRLLNSNKVFKGFEWLDQLLFDDENGLLILGFHSANFLVWSCLKSQKLLEISCGGGHRGWSCRLREDSARFVYIKARDVVICEASLPPNQKVLKPSHHGRQQTNIKHLFSQTNSKGQTHHVCITCSDDTTIQVIGLSNDHSKNIDLHVLLSLPGHISSVQTLACLKAPTPSCWENGQSYLLFSAGGRAQLNCYRLTFLPPKIQEEEEDGQKMVCIPQHLCSEFLVKRLPKHWAAKDLTVDPETRVMGLTSFYGQSVHPRIPKSIVFIGMACSDGTVRLFCFDEESHKLHSLWQSFASSCCILQVGHFVHCSSKDNTSNKIFLISAATDGYIRFWEVTSFCHSVLIADSKENSGFSENNRLKKNVAHGQQDLSENCSNNTDDDCDAEKSERESIDPVLKTQTICEREEESDFQILANMSGINSLHVKQLTDSSYMLASGGDDNAFFVTSFSLYPADSSAEHRQIACGSSLKNEFGHAAQITGIYIINENFIVTSSIDQRICVWELQLKKTEPKYVCVLCRYVEVADLSSIDVWKHGHRLFIAVCGAGLCVLSVDSEYFENGDILAWTTVSSKLP